MKKTFVNVLSALLVTAAFAVLVGCQNAAAGDGTGGGDDIYEVTYSVEVTMSGGIVHEDVTVYYNRSKNDRIEKISMNLTSPRNGNVSHIFKYDGDTLIKVVWSIDGVQKPDKIYDGAEKTEIDAAITAARNRAFIELGL